MKRPFLCCLLCTLLFASMGCQVMVMHIEVDVSVENRSSRDIENARARFGGFACSWGLLSSGAKKIHGQYPHPITAEAELHWEVNGQHKSRKFDLRELYSPGRSGRLAFTIYDDRAEVSFRELSSAK